MRPVLVDSNVILDLFTNDPRWAGWSQSTLDTHARDHDLCINPVIYAEVSIGFDRIEDLENAVNGCGFRMVDIPREALFLAGKAFRKYKRRSGVKTSTLPDFFIGAHAAVTGMDLITRDGSRYGSYFPSVRIIAPAKTG
ncbi:MAG: PIN domain-containing protein [Spirochaetes bacterium]|nr:MAG: PIN domain-containing protein [Spirochaetota bacterium]